MRSVGPSRPWPAGNSSRSNVAEERESDQALMLVISAQASVLAVALSRSGTRVKEQCIALTEANSWIGKV